MINTATNDYPSPSPKAMPVVQPLRQGGTPSLAEIMADTHTLQQRSANMRAVRCKDTAPERLIRSALHRLGFRFRLHRKDLPGTPDIVLPGRRSAVFVNGCFWHGHECSRGALPASNREFWERKISNNRERDERARAALKKDGWKVLTLWQCETKDHDALQRRLSRFLLRKESFVS